jgi:hypothetical protein
MSSQSDHDPTKPSLPKNSPVSSDAPVQEVDADKAIEPVDAPGMTETVKTLLVGLGWSRRRRSLVIVLRPQ